MRQQTTVEITQGADAMGDYSQRTCCCTLSAALTRCPNVALFLAGKLTETQVLLSHPEPLHLDRYGFIVTAEEAKARAARSRRTKAQQQRDKRHVAKWRTMIGSDRADFERYCALRPKKVKRRVRKGIPDEFRGLVWQYLSGG